MSPPWRLPSFDAACRGLVERLRKAREWLNGPWAVSFDFRYSLFDRARCAQISAAGGADMAGIATVALARQAREVSPGTSLQAERRRRRLGRLIATPFASEATVLAHKIYLSILAAVA